MKLYDDLGVLVPEVYLPKVAGTLNNLGGLQQDLNDLKR